jgi:hypothetical protein
MKVFVRGRRRFGREDEYLELGGEDQIKEGKGS